MNLKQNIRRASKLLHTLDDELLIKGFNRKVNLRYISIDDLLYDLNGLMASDTPYYEVIYSRDKVNVYLGDYFMADGIYMSDMSTRLKTTLELYIILFSNMLDLPDINRLLKWHTVLYDEVNNIVAALLD